MTVIVEPSPDNTLDPSAIAAAIHHAFGDYIAPPTESPHAQHDSRIYGGPLNAFSYAGATDVSSGIEISIDTGEAFIGGHWVASDETLTTVIDESTDNQRVYIGVDRATRNSVILGKDADFPSSADPRIPLYLFDTDTTTVTQATSERPVGADQAQYKGVYSISEADNRFYTQTYIDNNFLTASGGGLESDLNFGQNQALNMLFHKTAGEIADAINAQVWYRTDLDRPRLEVQTPRGIKQIPLEDLYYTIEDWESGDLSNWNVYGGGTSTITTDSYNGQYAFRQYGGTARTYSHPVDDGALEYYPQAGDYWEWYWKPLDMTGQARHIFGRGQGTASDSPAKYEIQTYGAGTFRLQEVTAGGTRTTIIPYYDVNWTLDNWYQIRHWWKHPDYSADHRIELYDMEADSSVVALTGDNANLNKDSGGVMLYTNQDSDSIWGDLHVRERTQ